MKKNHFSQGPQALLLDCFLVFYKCRLHTYSDRPLKVELIHGKTYNTRQEAKTAIFEYIEVFYNRQRRHSYLGYLSPVDFEKKNVD